MSEVLYKNYISFKILDATVNLISEENDNVRNTVAEIDGKYYYLGDEFPNVTAAVIAWQEFYDSELSEDQILQVMKDNNL